MRLLKKFLKIFINIKTIKSLTIFLLQKRLIIKRFKNLIELDGFNRIYKSDIFILNNKKDSVSRDLILFGLPRKEREVFLEFLKKIEEAKTFLDIGAGIGLFTLFAIETNKEIKTLSVEANPEVFRILKENLEFHQNFNLDKVILNKAVSNYPDEIKFFVPTGDDFSYGSIEKSYLDKQQIQYREIFLETTNLEEFKDMSFEIIKIDVEGSELDVLLAIQHFLDSCSYLFIEIMKKNKQSVFKLLADNEFKLLIDSRDDIGNYIFTKNITS